MFIGRRCSKILQLRWERNKVLAAPRRISLLSELEAHFDAAIYKHFIPNGIYCGSHILLENRELRLSLQLSSTLSPRQSRNGLCGKPRCL